MKMTNDQKANRPPAIGHWCLVIGISFVIRISSFVIRLLASLPPMVVMTACFFPLFICRHDPLH